MNNNITFFFYLATLAALSTNLFSYVDDLRVFACATMMTSIVDTAQNLLPRSAIPTLMNDFLLLDRAGVLGTIFRNGLL